MQKQVSPVVIVVIVLVLLVGGWLYWNHLNAPPVVEKSKPSVATQSNQQPQPYGQQPGPGIVKPPSNSFVGRDGKPIQGR